MSKSHAGPMILAGALDTKSAEYEFLRDRLEKSKVKSLLLDFGVLGETGITADISREEVAKAAGADLQELRDLGDRNLAMEAMSRGAANVVRRLYAQGQASGIIVLGGSNAGYVMSQIADVLPFGCPKILVSTIVSGDTRPYVGTSDLTMMYPVVDIAGLNSVSYQVLANAADACAGMALGESVLATQSKGTIGSSMFGVTTDCVSHVRDEVESQGYEFHTFHATGTGGKALESMIRAGIFTAVADITTTELADELLGGVCSAGPSRLDGAAGAGIPQVVSVGALDMANFGALDSVPAEYRGRHLIAHNPAVTLMRTSPQECAQLGQIMAEKLNKSTAFVEVLVPAKGFSQISVEGAPFHDPEADQALIQSLKDHLDPRIPLHILDMEINDPRFAQQITQSLSRALGTMKGNNNE